MKHKIKNNFPFKNWFAHVSSKSDENYQKKVMLYFESLRQFNARTFFSEIKHLKTLNYLNYFLAGIKGDRSSKRLLYKDPIAFMSAEWIAENQNAKVIVLIRHPAAFIASLKVKDWQFDFKNFINQRLLMVDYLKSYKDQIEKYANNQPDIVSQGILLWNIFHSLILKFQEKNENDWYFVRHEDLSTNPIHEFKKITNFLNLDFTSEIEKEIKRTTSGIQLESTNYIRNSIENITSWKKRLSMQEIDRIKKETFGVWSNFYSDEEW